MSLLDRAHVQIPQTGDQDAKKARVQGGGEREDILNEAKKEGVHGLSTSLSLEQRQRIEKKKMLEADW